MISIISDGVELPNLVTDVGVSDDEADAAVDNLVKAAREGFCFSNSHFQGGPQKLMSAVCVMKPKKQTTIGKPPELI